MKKFIALVLCRETKLYYLNARYYNPDWRRFISPDSTGYIDTENINGLNLYAYAKNHPINITYFNARADIGIYDEDRPFIETLVANTKTSGIANFNKLVNAIDTASTIHGLYTSISGLANHTFYFIKNLEAFADDMKMIGASMKDGVLAFNQFGWGLEKADVLGILLGVGLDVYDSVQRGVSTGGVILGATLTAAKGVGLIYLNKGIMYLSTTIGSCFGPVGTVVGFVVGGIVCIVVDVFVSNWLGELIDKVAK